MPAAKRALVVLITAGLSLGGPSALLAEPILAEPITKEQRRAVEAHTNAGVKFYNVGKFDAAIAEFQKAYEAVPDATLLFNMGKAHWRNGAADKASFAFKRYLQMAPMNDPDRPTAEKHIKQIEADIHAEQQKAKAAPPVAPPVAAALPTPAMEGQRNAAAPAATAQPDATGADAHETVKSANNQTDQHRIRLSVATGLAQPLLDVQTAMKDRLQLESPSLFNLGVALAYLVPLNVGALDIGAAGSWSPLPYIQMGTADQELRTNLVTLRATGAWRFPITDQISFGPTAGAGVAWWTSLDRDNPFTGGRAAGAVVMPSMRAGLAALWRLGSRMSLELDLGGSYSRPTGDLLPKYLASVVLLDATVSLGFGL